MAIQHINHFKYDSIHFVHKAALMALATMADDQGIVWAYEQDMRRRCCIGREAMANVIGVLEASGYITKTDASDPSPYTMYRLNMGGTHISRRYDFQAALKAKEDRGEA